MKAGNLFSELKRRRVIRALVGYGIAAFAVLQIIEPVMHGLRWPESVLSYVVVALGAGFPIVVTLAWIFDVKAGGIERTAPATSGPRGTRLALILVGIGVLAAVPGLFWYFVWPGHAKPEAQAGSSIAVVPFVNLSAEKENEYFSDGITEELINALANVDGLRVASRTSVYALKGRNLDAREIGERLNVKTLLEGSVRREGSALRVTAQLINVSDDVHLWSKTFDRELKSVFALEDEIAHSIAQTLRQKLVGRELVHTATTSSAAHDLYLQARSFSARRTGGALRVAEALYAQAAEKDPAYALAWVGKAEASTLRNQYDREFAAGVLPKAKESALKALQIDPSLAEAHAVLGLVAFYSYQWAEAERALRKAIELNPRYPSAHHWLSLVLSSQGRLAEGYAEADRAYQLDPTSPIVNNLVGATRLEMRDFDGAVEAFRKAFEIAPAFSPSHGYLGEVYATQKRYAEAESEYDKCAMPGYSDRGRGVMYALAGRRADALRVLDQLEQRAKGGYASPTARGMIQIALGEKDRGYALLEQGCAENDWLLWDTKVDPLFESLRAEPRFHEILKCVHLE